MFVSDNSLCFHGDVMLCLYQVTEYMRFSDTVDNHWTSTTIPTVLFVADNSLCLHGDVMLCLYQVTEYMRFSDTIDNH